MQSLKMAVQGAFMYIEGIFYTDRRGQGRVVDYVSPIKAFCDEHFISAPSPPGDEAEAMPVKKRHVQGEPGKKPLCVEKESIFDPWRRPVKIAHMAHQQH